MENASRALLMAGGILIAIILISTLIISYTRISDMEATNIKIEEIKEIEKFNRVFLSYQKNAMYGNDVITVLNLAINNNNIYKTTPDEEFYVNITFTLKENIEETIYTYTLDENTGNYNSSKQIKTTNDFEANKEYSLKTDYELIKSLLDNSNFSDSIIFDREYKKNTKTIIAYKERYNITANFKRFTFKCSEVYYDNNGRVIEMKFMQI